MTKDWHYSLMANTHRKLAIFQIRKLEKKLLSLEARFAISFEYRGRGYFKCIEPRQNPFEIEELYKRICKLS